MYVIDDDVSITKEEDASLFGLRTDAVVVSGARENVYDELVQIAPIIDEIITTRTSDGEDHGTTSNGQALEQ